VLFLLSLPAAAQVTIGDDLSLNANGNISAGYSGNYGNQIDSSHGISVGGNAALTGFFYSPNFLSFDANPYYNQSRNNTGFGSISDATGVSLSSSIFGGSHFPGSVNYSTAYNNTGNYGIPGITSLNTDGNSQNFGINWGAFVPGLPTLSVGYQLGSSNYHLYGTNESGNADFNSFNINSSYNLVGFGLSAGIIHANSDALIPGVIIGGQTATSNADTTSYVFNVGHSFPWHGNFNANFSRTDLNSDYLGYTFNGDIDLVNANISMHPTPKLTFSLSGDYTDNLSGSLYQALVPGTSSSALGGNSSASSINSAVTSGGTSSGTTGLQSNAQQESSHGMDFLFNATYAFAKNLQADGLFERRQQSYLGTDYGSNLFGGGVTYTRQIAGGYLGSSVNLVDSTVDTSSQNQLGFNVTTNYSRRFGQWQGSGYFSYAQNVQTLLVTYTTSGYSFSGSLNRKIGRWYWSGSAGTGRSGLTAQPGTSSSSESFGTSLGTRYYSFSANYAKSDGNALASGGGLIPTQLPPIIPTNLLVLYGGESYAIGFSAAPKRGLNASVSFVKSRSNLDNLGVSSWNNFEQANVYLQYQFRQLGMNGGYTHLVQGFSASGTAPASFSSFYIGVYRWFNFF
jgi:hypothetical protein